MLRIAARWSMRMLGVLPAPPKGEPNVVVVQCHKCGTAVSPSAKRCHCCRSELVPVEVDKHEELSPGDRAAAGLGLASAYMESEQSAAPREYSFCCSQCEASYTSEMRFCPKCGNPTPHSASMHAEVKRATVPDATAISAQQLLVEEMQKHPKRAGRNFLWMGVLVVLWAFFAMADAAVNRPAGGEAVTLIAFGSIFIGTMVLGLAFLARRKPFRAMLVGMLLYVSLLLLFAQIDRLAVHPEKSVILLGIRFGMAFLLLQTISTSFKHRRMHTWARSLH